jgi:hypothetical protein
MHRNALTLSILLALPLALAGCDLPGVEPASAIAARKEAEGKAVGGACRHAGRAIEDCYTLNKKADKSAVFNGWREMNDYMRENKIETVSPQIPTPALLAAKQAGQAGDAEAEHATEEPATPPKAAKAGTAKASAGDKH